MTIDNIVIKKKNLTKDNKTREREKGGLKLYKTRIFLIENHLRRVTLHIVCEQKTNLYLYNIFIYLLWDSIQLNINHHDESQEIRLERFQHGPLRVRHRETGS